MPLIKYLAVFMFYATWCCAQTESCINTDKVMAIGKELHEQFKESNFCANPVNLDNLKWLTKVALPQVMNRPFLGVDLPPNLYSTVDSAITECYAGGNLCIESVRMNYFNCLLTRLPLVDFQIRPWLDNNCRTINQKVIDHWSDKKLLVMHLIREYMKQFHVVQSPHLTSSKAT